jgi:ubiquinone/menaquinone biosynthesis C-methylase UbiE
MFDFMSDYVGLKILHPGGIDATKQLLDILSIEKDMKVLDIACGKGRTSVQIAKKYGCKVVGIDILENSIKEAKEHAKKHGVEHLVSFQVANAEKLPFNDNEFDITLAQAMLILVNDKSKVVREASRVLKPTGRSGWIELSWKKSSDNEFLERASKEICAKCISNVVTFDDWQNIFKQSGYPFVKVSRYDMTYRGFTKMLSDEGFINSTRVMYRYISKPKIRKRMQKLNNFFKSYPEYLGYGIYLTEK